MSGPEPTGRGTPRDLERDLATTLRDPLPPGRLAELDARVSRMAAAGPPSRPAGMMRRGWAALGTLATTALIVALAVVVLGNGRNTPPVAASPSLAVVDPADVSTPTPSAVAPSAVAPSPPASTPSASPEPAPTDGPASPTNEPTAEPTARPTPDPTPRPTEKATARPPKPTPDPAPEPTTRIYAGSGTLGSSLTVHGVTVTMARTDIPGAVGDVCANVGRETYAYTFRMDTDHPKGVNEPYVGVGAHQYSAVWMEPSFAVNRTIIVVVCHKPDDGNRVFVEMAPDGTPMTLYQWRFVP